MATGVDWGESCTWGTRPPSRPPLLEIRFNGMGTLTSTAAGRVRLRPGICAVVVGRDKTRARTLRACVGPRDMRQGPRGARTWFKSQDCSPRRIEPRAPRRGRLQMISQRISAVLEWILRRTYAVFKGVQRSWRTRKYGLGTRRTLRSISSVSSIPTILAVAWGGHVWTSAKGAPVRYRRGPASSTTRAALTAEDAISWRAPDTRTCARSGTWR
jgi:hypothetical protein